METRFTRSKVIDFLFQCLSLSTPSARVVTFSLGVIALTFLNISSLGLPSFCIWERIFGYCPASGTTRALNAFFHGKWEESIKYNLNILAVIPIIIGIFVMDIFKLVRTRDILRAWNLKK